MSKSHERRINLPPLRRLLVYQKLRQRIIYETRLAGFRLRSVGAGDMSQCNLIEIRSDCSRGGEETWTGLDPVCRRGESVHREEAVKKSCCCCCIVNYFYYSWRYRLHAEDHMQIFLLQLLNYAVRSPSAFIHSKCEILFLFMNFEDVCANTSAELRAHVQRCSFMLS